MSVTSTKIYLPDLKTTQAIQFKSDILIQDVIAHVRDKFNFPKAEYGLLFQNEKVWLNPTFSLEKYQFTSKTILEFRKKRPVLKVKLADDNIIAVPVDLLQTIYSIVDMICESKGIENCEVYSLYRENPTNSGKGLEFKSNGWLNPHQSIRDQGISENDTLLLRKKFYVGEFNLELNDPTQIQFIYGQSLDMIITGSHPVNIDECAQLGGLQMQAQFGNHDPNKHKLGFISLKNFAPPEYAKNKELEKKILAEHIKFNGLNELDAKYYYLKICQTSKTYSFSFFEAKELPSKLRKKSRMILLGFFASKILRLDQKTKDILSQWEITQLRRWIVTDSGFLLDFGEYENEVFEYETAHGLEVSKAIRDYINFFVKRANRAKNNPETTKSNQRLFSSKAEQPSAAGTSSNITSKIKKNTDDGHTPTLNSSSSYVKSADSLSRFDSASSIKVFDFHENDNQTATSDSNLNIELNDDVDIDVAYDHFIKAADEAVYLSSKPSERIRAANALATSASRLAKVLDFECTFLKFGKERTLLERNLSEFKAELSLIPAAANAVTNQQTESTYVDCIMDLKDLVDAAVRMIPMEGHSSQISNSKPTYEDDSCNLL